MLSRVISVTNTVSLISIIGILLIEMLSIASKSLRASSSLIHTLILKH